MNQVLSRSKEPEVAHDPLLNPTSMIVQKNAAKSQGKEGAGTMQNALEDLVDEDHVTLHCYLANPVEEAPRNEPRRTLSCGKKQNARLVGFNGPQLFPLIFPLALVLHCKPSLHFNTYMTPEQDMAINQ